MGLRLIRSTNSEEVTVYDDAVVFHSAKGHDYTGELRGGVFEKVYKSFNSYFDSVQQKFIVESGQGMLYGRQFELRENETIEFYLGNLAGKYIVIYIEMSVEKGSNGNEIETISMKHTWGSYAYPSIGNTDLIRNRYGVATMELYRLKLQSDGSLNATDKKDRRYFYKPGYAEKARMMDGEGVINGRKISNLIYPDKDLVIHTDHAYYADRAQGLGNTGTGAVRNAIDDNLYMKNRDAYLVSACEIPLKADFEVWEKNTSHEITLSIPSGHVIGAFLYGTAVQNDNPYIVGDPTAFPFTISRQVTNNETVIVTVNRTKATVTLGDVMIDGQLYLTLLMIGSV